ncbi:hypothetical protein ACWEPM_20415 [Streptomyces sp. NPDC004244]
MAATAGEHELDRLTRLGAVAVVYGAGWPERVKAVAPQDVDRVFDSSGAGVLADSVAPAGGCGPRDHDRGHGRRPARGALQRRRPGGPPPAGPSRAGRARRRRWAGPPIGAVHPLAEAARAHAGIEAAAPAARPSSGPEPSPRSSRPGATVSSAPDPAEAAPQPRSAAAGAPDHYGCDGGSPPRVVGLRDREERPARRRGPCRAESVAPEVRRRARTG